MILEEGLGRKLEQFCSLGAWDIKNIAAAALALIPLALDFSLNLFTSQYSRVHYILKILLIILQIIKF